MMTPKYKILFSCISILTFYFFTTLVFANSISENITRQEFTNSLYQAMEANIPGIEDIIIGYRQGDSELDSLLIVNFDCNTKDERIISYALGEILRYEVSLTTANQIFMPGYHLFYRDSEFVFKNSNNKKHGIDDIKRLAKMWSVNNTVSGRLKIIDDKYQWSVKIDKLNKDTKTLTKQWHGKLDNLPMVITEVIQFILSDATNNSIDNIKTNFLLKIKDFETLRDYGTFIVNKSKKDSMQLRQHALNAWESGLKLPAVGVTLLQNLRINKENPIFYDNMMYEVATNFEHPHIQALHALMQGQDGDFANKNEHIETLQSLIIEYPEDPTLMFSLSNLLAETYQELASISLARETIIRWPGLHRSWATVSNSLFHYSWQIRGNEYWKRVPDQAKREFRNLQKLSGKAADNCATYATGHPLCTISKMLTNGGYSHELINLFKNTIKLEPHNMRPYAITLNFAAKKWGGSLKLQKRILAIARKNNPDSEWIDDIRKKWAPKISAPNRYIVPSIIVIIITALVIAFILMLRAKRSN